MTERVGQGRGAVNITAAPRSRSFARQIMLAAGALLLFAGFFALGTWQLYRLQWKLALINRVNHRVNAAAVAAPGHDRWPYINAEADEYRHVFVTGTFLYDRTTPVLAVTELGGGYWLLTPFKRDDGSIVLVNRGFVTTQAGDQVRTEPRRAAPAPGQLQSPTVTGLLRMSEPGGAFLHHNNPAANRWYSRDVQAIAAARGLANVAPYFIDADATQTSVRAASAGSSPSQPVGGLTVIHFRNSHLSYAITWYTLALMVAGATIWVVRDERRLQRRKNDLGADSKGESDDARRN